MTVPADSKAAYRRAARARRAAIAASNPGASAAVAQLLSESGLFPADAAIAGYAGVGDEIDPMPLLARLSRDHVCALPLVGEARVLSFRRWQPGMALEPGRHGIPAPPLDSPAVVPDILLVPLLAFDDRGYRIGYGGGYYDATLAALRAVRPVTAIGLAYAAQRVEHVPDEPWDERLDMIATERGIVRFGRETGE